MKARAGACLAALIATLCLGGCALLAPPPPPAHKALLDKTPAAAPPVQSAQVTQGAQGARPARPTTLVVLPPQTLSVYDTTQMAYSQRPHEVAYFRDHEWAATPSQMLEPLLLQTLQATRAFAAVVSPPDSERASYVLRTQIAELLQDFGANPPVARVSLHVQLSGGTTPRTASADIVVREPLRERTPLSGAAATNEATAKALAQVARFVLENTAAGSAR